MMRYLSWLTGQATAAWICLERIMMSSKILAKWLTPVMLLMQGAARAGTRAAAAAAGDPSPACTGTASVRAAYKV